MSVGVRQMLGTVTRWFILVVSVLWVSTSLGAYDSKSNWRCGQWDVGGYALYFTQVAGPYTYAATREVDTQGAFTRQVGSASQIPCEANWGFRVFGDYLQDCLFVSASYQWIRTTASQNLTSANQTSVRGGANVEPGRAIGQAAAEYQNVDLRVGTYLLRGCRASLYLYGNGRWVDFAQWHTLSFTASNSLNRDFLHDKSTLRGGAIGMGLGSKVDVGCGFGVFVDGNVLGVIGQRAYVNPMADLFRPGIEFRKDEGLYPSQVCILPEFDFRIGLDYAYRCGCYTLVGEVGYEVDYFLDAALAVRTVGINAFTSTINANLVCESMGFAGLFFAGRVLF